MKMYGAIGHFKESKNITFVTHKNHSMKDFKTDLKGNAFVPYMIVTSATMHAIRNDADVWEMVKRKVTNYRKWEEVTEYIAQCFDIMEERFYK